jgi:hypothetical protein
MFKKTLAAVAVGMVAFGAQAAEFTAGDVAFQVNLDAQAEYLQTKAAVGAGTTLNGAGQIQLKATKLVNNDLNAFGAIEVAFDPVIADAPVIADDMKIGLSSKSFGSITFGQYDSYMEDNIAEALGYTNPGVADIKVSEPSIGGRGRQIQYMGKFGDFTGVAAISSSNATSPNTGEQSLGNSFVLGYESGPLRAYVGTNAVPKYVSNTYAIATVKTNVGASIYYTFGNTTISGLTARQTSTADLDTTYNGLAVKHVMGDFDVAVALQSRTVNTASASTTASQYTLHGGYTVTKGTKFYVGLLGLGATDNVGDLMAAGFSVSF